MARKRQPLRQRAGLRFRMTVGDGGCHFLLFRLSVVRQAKARQPDLVDALIVERMRCERFQGWTGALVMSDFTTCRMTISVWKLRIVSSDWSTSRLNAS